MALDLMALITESTCGEACWKAREDVCRCSCAGKNHGCLQGQEQRPERTRKLNGYLYQLAAISVRPTTCYAELLHKMDDTKRSIMGRISAAGLWPRHRYESEPGYPVKLKTASPSEIARWPEFSGWNPNDTWPPVGVWVRCDLAAYIQD